MKINQLSEVSVNDLKPNPWNTNIVSPENELKLEQSLKKYGVFKPIIVRQTSEGLQILGGEHRFRAAKSLGYTTVPVVNLGPITDKKAKEIGLIDNSRYGDDDVLQLGELLKGLDDDLANILPYSEQEWSNIFSASDIDFDDLNLDGDEADEQKSIEDMLSDRAPMTHQLMRFKVPVEDAEWVTKLIDTTMKVQGLTGEDSLSNAGNALVHLLAEFKK